MKGVVLDFDGVIARSMELHAAAYRRVLAPYGVNVQELDVFLREGGRSETIIQDLLQTNGVKTDASTVKRLADEKQRVYAVLGPLTLYPGAEAFVKELRGAADRLGLVTGTRRENLERIIPHLLPKFDSILTPQDYAKDKPDPEPYANAARALGVQPQRCAAVENAVRGVQSAKAAGFGLVVAITTTLPKYLLSAAGADAVVDSHPEAVKHIHAWLSKLPTGARAA